MSKALAMSTAAVMAFTLGQPGALANSPESDRTNVVSAQSSTARWHVTGQWEGAKHGVGGFWLYSKLRIKRNSSGHLHGSGVYRYSKGDDVVCRTNLRFLKRTQKGWMVFREHFLGGSGGYCGWKRIRIHRWPKSRLKVYWQDSSRLDDRGTLHRP